MSSTEIAQFLFPNELVRARGASQRVGELLKIRAVPGGAVVVVADRVVHEQGLTGALLTGLAEQGYEPHVFAEIAGEPELQVVEKAAVVASEVKAVAVIGIGGGSALDTAKLVAYHSVSETPLVQLKGVIPQVAGFPPLVMVPTTVGTGAEATRVAMFAIDGAKRMVLSPQFVPLIAVLDDELVGQLPASVVASTGMDALAHAVESMMSTVRNDLTWMFSTEAAGRIFERLPAAHEGDQDARSELLYASFLAGVSLNAGVVLGHSMSYVLSARFGLAHGTGCAMALPYCLAYNQTMSESRQQAIAEGVLRRPGVSLRQLADAVQELTRTVGLPTDLTGHGGTSADDAPLAEHLIRDYPRPTNPVPLEPDRLTGLLAHLRTGDLSGAWTSNGELS